MKQLLSIATAAFLTCGLVGARASAGDCNSCDTCGSYGKTSFFSGLFHKKSCGGCDTCSTPVSTSYSDCCDDSCGKKKKHFGFSFFGKKDCNSCGCDTAPVSYSDCCEDSCGKKKHKWFKGDDCGCDSSARKLSLPKINFFKRGCGCDTGCDTGCNGYGGNGQVIYGGTTYGGAPQGGVIIHQAPASGGLAPVPGVPSAQPILRPVQPAPVPAPAGTSAPVPVPAGS
jgi:hypothetical protein